MLMLMTVLLLMAACGKAQSNSNVLGSNTEVIYGHIVECNPQAKTIMIDRVELVSENDTDRIGELGLRTSEFRNGYYLYNATAGRRLYAVDNDVLFNFDNSSTVNNGTNGTGNSTTNGSNNTINNNGINGTTNNTTNNTNNTNKTTGSNANGTTGTTSMNSVSGTNVNNNNNTNNNNNDGFGSHSVYGTNNGVGNSNATGVYNNGNVNGNYGADDTANGSAAEGNQGSGLLGSGFGPGLANSEAASLYYDWESGFEQLTNSINSGKENLYRITIENNCVTSIRDCSYLLSETRF